jgi:hypothetical protein
LSNQIAKFGLSIISTGSDVDYCRLHGKDQRIGAVINDCILTEDLSTINEGIPRGYMDYTIPERQPRLRNSEPRIRKELNSRPCIAERSSATLDDEVKAVQDQGSGNKNTGSLLSN